MVELLNRSTHYFECKAILFVISNQFFLHSGSDALPIRVARRGPESPRSRDQTTYILKITSNRFQAIGINRKNKCSKKVERTLKVLGNTDSTIIVTTI